MLWWTFFFLLPNCASERGLDWHSDGLGFFDGRLQVPISGAWQACLFIIAQLVSAPTDASAPASWFDLVVVSFLWFVTSAPAGAPAPACKGAAQAPAPVSAPAPSSGPLLSAMLATVSIWFWAHGLVPQ